MLSIGSIVLLALLSSESTSADGAPNRPRTGGFMGFSLRHGPCDESFPLAVAQPTPNHVGRHQQRLVAVPDDNTGRTYAPLCPDGRHIDTRRIQTCNNGACWSEMISVRTHVLHHVFSSVLPF